MSPTNLTIAVFRGTETETLLRASGRQRPEVTLWPLDSCGELCTGGSAAGVRFDALVVPLRLADGQSGVTIGLRCRTIEHLTAAPLIGLAASRERPLLTPFFGAGIDVILAPPLDPEYLALQVSALLRRNRALEEHAATVARHLAPEHPLLPALQCVSEGVALISHTGELLVINSSARRLLGIPTDAPLATLGPMAVQLNAVVAQRSPGPAETAEIRATVTRVDGRPVGITVRVQSIYPPTGEPPVTALVLTDTAPLAQLENLLEQDQRTRSLALLGAAGCYNLLTSRGGPHHSLVPQIEHAVVGARSECSLGAAVTALLEVLDVAMNPGASVRIDLAVDEPVGVRVGDLFLILGHLILHCVARAGIGGATTITSGRSEHGIEVTLLSEIASAALAESTDPIAALVHRTWSERAAHPAAEPALAATRAAAQGAGVTIRERRLDGIRTSYVVTLPLARPAAE